MVISINTHPQDTITRVVHSIPDEWKRDGFNTELYRRARGCLSKDSFGSRRQARLTADSYERRRGVKLGVYHCPHCGKYHLTSKRLQQSA